MKRLVKVLASPRREGMYLYVDHDCDPASLPDALLGRFGTPRTVMTLVLTPQRQLARVKAADVLEGIAERGFFLQMPPTVPGADTEAPA
jgi:hypothetical protein